jgi:hypothetical protein
MSEIRPMDNDNLLERYNCGPVKLSGNSEALYERHLTFDQVAASDHFGRNEPGIFAPIVNTLLRDGDHYRHLADLTSSGKFSSDRTIAEYAREIWHAKPCLVD